MSSVLKNGRENVSKKGPVNIKKLLNMAMANSHVAYACARQIYLFMHFTDAQKIYWMHGCPSLRIICIHALHGENSWPVKKIPSYLTNQISAILFPFYVGWRNTSFFQGMYIYSEIQTRQTNYDPNQWMMAYLFFFHNGTLIWSFILGQG